MRMSVRLDSHHPQSAVIPYRWRNGQLEVCVITSRGSGGWIVPKGTVEADLTPWDSAAKEAWEEAGLRGEVTTTPLGNYIYRKRGRTNFVDVFVMEVSEVIDDYDEAHQRDRRWLPYDQAAERIDVYRLRRMVRQLPEVIACAEVVG